MELKVRNVNLLCDEIWYVPANAYENTTLTHMVCQSCIKACKANVSHGPKPFYHLFCF